VIAITEKTKNELSGAIKLHLTRKFSTKLETQSISRQIRPKRAQFGNYLHRGRCVHGEANQGASVYLKWISKWPRFAKRFTRNKISSG
jgi:hypothetical protein